MMRGIYIMFLVLLALSKSSLASPITNPYRANGDITKVIPEYFDTKNRLKNYQNSTPIVLDEVPFLRYDRNDPSCNVGFRVKWSSSVGSSVYSSPVLFPSPSTGVDGKAQLSIFLATFYQYVEVLGYDGFKPWGWPLSFEDSSFQGSPLLYDIDGDGTNDIGVVDKDANLHWIRVGEFGQYLDDYHTQVPRLKIKKDWAVGLDPDFTDSYVMLSMFDHKNFNEHVAQFNKGGDGEVNENIKGRGKARQDELLSIVKQDSYPELHSDSSSSSGSGSAIEDEIKNKETAKGARRKLLSIGDVDMKEGGGVAMGLDIGEHHEEKNDHNLHNGGNEHAHVHELNKEEGGGLEGGGEISSNSAEHQHQFDQVDGTEGTGVAMDDYISRRDGGGASYGGGYRSFDDGYRYYMGMGGGMYNESNFVFVDPHVLGSPTLVDVNGDGHMEVLMAVSYYFDSAQYAGKELDYDPSLYVAGGLACWDLQANEWSWMVHLDLTTDHTKFKALIYGTPTVADLDGNGRFEILIGTSLGLLYLLDGETGFVRRYFPMQFHEIQAQIAVADVRGGSDLEIIVADMGGNLVLVDVEGEILWDIQLSGSLPHTPTVGDVDGDGTLDIVVMAVHEKGCHLWAVNGATGKPLPGYPIAMPLGAMASSPVLLVDLHDYSDELKRSPARYADPSLPVWMQNTPGHEPAPSPSLDISPDMDSVDSVDEEKKKKKHGAAHSAKKHHHKDISLNKGLHLIVPLFDGHIHVIDGKIGCAERIDIGEHVYSVPLIADVTGNGMLDLVLGTMNGQIMLLETNVPSHPLNSWLSFPKHRLNGFTHGQIGISIPEVERRALRYADIKGMGRNLSVTFDIWDTRSTSHERKEGELEHAYSVTFTSGTNKLAPLAKAEFSKPGRYTVQVPISPPVSMTLVVSMLTEHGLYFEDALPVAVGTRFYVWIKYLVLTPIFLLCMPLLFMRSNAEVGFKSKG